MKRLLSALVFGLLLAQSASAAEPQAEDYTLSMTGALINDHCSRIWQGADYVNQHACNYELANQFTLEIASRHFSECTVQANGDIVMIADCMVARFGAWLGEREANN